MADKIRREILRDEGRAMSMTMSSMGMNMHVTFMHHLAMHMHWAMTIFLHRQSLAKMPSLIITRRKAVDHQGRHGRKHCDEPGEREIPPRVFAEARTRQALKSIRKNVDETSGQNHTGGKGFDHEEDVVFGTKSLDFLAQDWERDANCAGHEYGTYRY